MNKKLILLAFFLCWIVSPQAQPKAEKYAYDLSYFLPEGNYTYDPAIPTPEKVLGFQLGQQHVDWGQVVDYMKALAAASDRVTVRETGRTYQFRPFIEVTIKRILLVSRKSTWP